MLPAVSGSGEQACPGEATDHLFHRGSRYRRKSELAGFLPSAQYPATDRRVAVDLGLLVISCTFFNPCSVTGLGLHVSELQFLHL